MMIKPFIINRHNGLIAFPYIIFNKDKSRTLAIPSISVILNKNYFCSFQTEVAFVFRLRYLSKDSNTMCGYPHEEATNYGTR